MLLPTPSTRFVSCLISVALIACVLLLSPSRASAQLPVTDDSFTQQGSPNANSGTATTLSVVGSATVARKTYIRVSLAPLPAGLTSSNVSIATLSLFVNSVTTAGTFDVYLITSPWTEKTITYSTAPTLGAQVASAVSVSTVNTYVIVNVTSALQAWLSGTANDGLAIVPSSGSTISVTFDSKESTTGSHPAEIDPVLVSVGPQGPPGPMGFQGPQGATGAVGPQGPSGAVGPQGPTGPAGATGAAGPAGAAGPQGSAGLSINWRNAWSNSINYAVNDAVSFNGSSYIAIASNTGAQPDTNPASWSLLASIGTAGPTGPAGAQGPMGLQGVPGATGATGPQGPQGASGPAGAQGPVGPTGATGATGATGPAGPTGPQGPPGVLFVSTILVSPAGTSTQNGNVLLSAVAAANVASATSPVLIKVEPGVYDVGATNLTVPSFVGIEGSGEVVTTILGDLVLNPNTELRNLSVNDNGQGSSGAILVQGPSQLKNVSASAFTPRVVNYGISLSGPGILLQDVHVTVSGASSTNRAISCGAAAPQMVNLTATATGNSTADAQAVYISNTTGAVLVNVTATATNGAFQTVGIFVDNSTASIASSRATAAGPSFGAGVWVNGGPAGGTAYVEDSQIVGNDGVIVSNGGTLFVGDSRVAGSVFLDTGNGSAITCAGAYNKNFVPLNATCQ